MSVPNTLANGPGNMPDADALMANFNYLTASPSFTGSPSIAGSFAVGTANIKKKLTLVDASSGNTTPGTNPIFWIGGGTGSTSTLSEIGFTYGFSGAYSETYAPATIGYQLTSGSGTTKGDLVFCTRNVTTDTAPTERMRIFAAGNVQITGTITNDTAPAGYVGEQISSTIGFTNFAATGVYSDLTSISLTAGDWDVTALGVLTNGATGTEWRMGISSTSGNSGSGLSYGDNQVGRTGSFPTANNQLDTLAIPTYRVSLSATTTYYFKFIATYTAGTPQLAGRLKARRVR